MTYSTPPEVLAAIPTPLLDRRVRENRTRARALAAHCALAGFRPTFADLQDEAARRGLCPSMAAIFGAARGPALPMGPFAPGTWAKPRPERHRAA